MYNGSNLGTIYTRKLNSVCYLGHKLGTCYDYLEVEVWYATYTDPILQYCARVPLGHFSCPGVRQVKLGYHLC